jgi:argininosuccinate lyase
MSKKLWGGRFTKEIDKDFFEFQKSIHYDYKLAQYDIQHSTIHIKALYKSKLLKEDEYKRLVNILSEVSKDIENTNEEKWQKILHSKEMKGIEDIHSYIQHRVEEKLPPRYKPLALKLHTLRSRNDQIVFDEKYYLTQHASDIRSELYVLLDSIEFLMENYKKQSFIGYTHTQRAQQISFHDYLLAYLKMFNRDAVRISSFRTSLPIYIGAGALAGKSLYKKAYNDAVKEYIKECSETMNARFMPLKSSVDNVSGRDFIIEFLSSLSIIQMHLSRFAEDFILYSTKEFNFVDLPEEFCTGSSMLPHKKNPDFLELVRGYTGQIYGNLFTVLTIMKGLPLSYNRDMQLDKEPLFSSIKIVSDELEIMAKFIKKVKLRTPVINKALKDDKTLYATKLAEWLVKKQNVPFKQAHDKVGRVIIQIEKRDGDIEKLEDLNLQEIHSALNKSVLREIMRPKYARLLKKK